MSKALYIFLLLWAVLMRRPALSLRKGFADLLGFYNLKQNTKNNSHFSSAHETLSLVSQKPFPLSTLCCLEGFGSRVSPRCAVESLMFVFCSFATWLRQREAVFHHLAPMSCLGAVSSPSFSVMKQLIPDHPPSSHTRRHCSDHIEPSLFWDTWQASFWPLGSVMCFSFSLEYSFFRYSAHLGLYSN